MSTIDRMLDLGVPKYLLAATLRGVLAQRLIRKRCPKCSNGECTLCEGSGYHGRTVVSELMSVSVDAAREIVEFSGQSNLSPLTTLGRYDRIQTVGKRLITAGTISSEDFYAILGDTN